MTLSLYFNELLLPQGWARDVRVEIEGGLVAAVTPGAVAGAGEVRHAVGVPGLGNLHSHAFQRGMAGLAEVRGEAADSFWSWREVMYRFLAVLTPEDVEAIAALAFAEMLEAGFTRVGEFHYLHHAADGSAYADIGEMAGRIGAASAEAGIALTLLPVFYAHGGFGGAAPAAGQRRFVCGRDGFAALLAQGRAMAAGLEDAVVGVAPHSLRAVTPEELGDLAVLAGDGPIHLHAAEQMREVEECVAWSGQRPIAWLLDHAGVGTRWCVIHATHMTEAETVALAKSGAVAGLCPITESSLGDGIFNGLVWRGAGGGFGVGTDSNIQITAAGELRQLEYTQRLRLRQRNVMVPGPGVSTGRALFQAALAGGAQALGSACGVEVGRPADLVSLDAGHPSLVGRGGDGWLDGWIFATPGTVETVWRRGRAVVQGGRHVRRAAIAARYRATLLRLMQAI